MSMINSMAVIGGTVIGTGFSFLNKKIEEKIGGPICAPLDKVIPFKVQEILWRGSTTANAPAKALHSKMIHEYNFQSTTFSNIFAPVLEEAIYRLGIQGGITFALNTIGLPEPVSTSIAIFVSSVMFGLGHNMYTDSSQFSHTTLMGVLFGVLQSQAGFSEAIAVHSFSNVIINWEAKK